LLRAKLGPAEVRLASDPSQKLPSQIPVYVPVIPGDVYHWKEVRWSGNALVSEFTLSGLIVSSAEKLPTACKSKPAGIAFVKNTPIAAISKRNSTSLLRTTIKLTRFLHDHHS